MYQAFYLEYTVIKGIIIVKKSRLSSTFGVFGKMQSRLEVHIYLSIKKDFLVRYKHSWCH